MMAASTGLTIRIAIGELRLALNRISPIFGLLKLSMPAPFLRCFLMP